MNAIDQIMAASRHLSTTQIVDCVLEIGAGVTNTPEERMVRAALVDLYQEREGEEAADRLMDEIGL